MTYQETTWWFHLRILGISKRQLPKMLWFGLDLNDKISQMNFLYHKLHNSLTTMMGLLLKFIPRRLIHQCLSFPVEKSFHCGEVGENVHRLKYFMHHMFLMEFWVQRDLNNLKLRLMISNTSKEPTEFLGELSNWHVLHCFQDSLLI